MKKTITKNSSFVILTLLFCFVSSACFSVSSQKENNSNRAEKEISAEYNQPKIVGEIESKEIRESSGLVASPCQENVFWTHNDSGNSAKIFAINSKGQELAVLNVSSAKNEDWEDIAAFRNQNGECFLYIGDVGNNARSRGEFIVYIVKEPRVSISEDAANNRSRSETNPFRQRSRLVQRGERVAPPKISETENAVAIKFNYPDFRHDAETLMVHPKTGDIYILTKRLSGASGVYKLAAGFDLKKTNQLEKIADVTVPAVPNGFLTGGDISPDGKRVIICDYFSAYELVLPESSKNFDDVWRATTSIVELGERQQGEAVCYSADGKSIFATSEKDKSPIIEVRRK